MNTKPCLVGFVARGIIFHPHAVGVFRPESFIETPVVFLDKVVGDFKYFFSAAIILFKIKNLSGRIIIFELLHIVGVGSAPAVYGLVVVAHNENVAVVACKQTENFILYGVRILKLVNADITVALPIFSQNFFVIPEQ